MKHLIALAAAAFAAPALAQPPAQAPSETPAPAAIDPERLGLARTTIDSVWPLGTYQRMMTGTMDRMMDSVMQSMADMKLGDMIPAGPAGGKPIDPKIANATFRETMARADPHFQERMRITNHVMMSEMVPIMSKFEPELREGLARAYARKFTAGQLNEMNRFFATPAGRFYASESMLTMMDPEVMGMMGKFAPEFVKAMPAIMAKVEQATAHLPRPSAARTHEAAGH
ncbi:MAG: hypothetical protein QOH81_572 [Sphingomonadales bacterium]|jgi:hypothetical protein|nr:hypothetical protein [Sphingomonadales bacterium]